MASTEELRTVVVAVAAESVDVVVAAAVAADAVAAGEMVLAETGQRACSTHHSEVPTSDAGLGWDTSRLIAFDPAYYTFQAGWNEAEQRSCERGGPVRYVVPAFDAWADS